MLKFQLTKHRILKLTKLQECCTGDILRANSRNGKSNKINGVSAHKTQQTEIYFIATSDIHITMNNEPYTIHAYSSQRGPTVSWHREDEKLMKASEGKKV